MRRRLDGLQPIPVSWSYAAVRWFHGRAARTLVTTASMQRQLEARGFRNLALWGRGVDTDLFRPRDKAFLDLPGTRLVVGDGPACSELRRRYPEVVFAGYRHCEDLRSAALAAAG